MANATLLYKTQNGSIESLEAVKVGDDYTFTFPVKHFVIALFFEGKRANSTLLQAKEQYVCTHDGKGFEIQKTDLQQAGRTLTVHKDLFFLVSSGGSGGTSAIAPYISSISPLSLTPLSTGTITLTGFFTPDTTISIASNNVLSTNFVSATTIKVTVEASATEGLYDITANNGIEVIFPSYFEVNVGIVSVPIIQDLTPSGQIDLTNLGSFKVKTDSIQGSAVWNRVIPSGTDFELRYKRTTSDIVTNQTQQQHVDEIEFLSQTTDQKVYGLDFYGYPPNPSPIIYVGTTTHNQTNNHPFDDAPTPNEQDFMFKRIGTTFYFYIDGVLDYTVASQPQVDMYIKFNVKNYNIVDVRIVE